MADCPWLSATAPQPHPQELQPRGPPGEAPTGSHSTQERGTLVEARPGRGPDAALVSVMPLSTAVALHQTEGFDRRRRLHRMTCCLLES